VELGTSFRGDGDRFSIDSFIIGLMVRFIEFSMDVFVRPA